MMILCHYSAPVFQNQIELFRYIWRNFGKLSMITGRKIAEPTASNFMHILPKGKYPEFKCSLFNVWLVEEKYHDIYDNRKEEGRKLKELQFLFAYSDYLKSKFDSLHA